MSFPNFDTSDALDNLINSYFNYIGGEAAGESVLPGMPEKNSNGNKGWKREPEPATITGMALYLGFSSIAELENYEQQGLFADTLKRGRLRIEAYYEKKLHQQSATGAIFALKSMGWKEKNEFKTEAATPGTLKIEIADTGIVLAAEEKDVIL